MLDIALLGTGGMMPMPGRFLSSMILRYKGKLLIVDCGEGTQVTLKMLGWGFKAIEGILFTHFHADHISGLPGMLLTIGNAGRTKPLILVGPTGLRNIVEGLRRIAPELPFPIEYMEIEENSANFELSGLDISCVEVEHRVKCFAYRFYVRRNGKFDPEKALKLRIPKKMWSVLQNGQTIVMDECEYEPSMVIGDKRRGISVSFCTDSRPAEILPEFVNGSDLLVCEGMYGDNEKIVKAHEYGHMLFSEAAKIASDGNVDELWLTHFSPSISDPNEYLDDTKDIFENTYVGYDRITKTINFKD